MISLNGTALIHNVLKDTKHTVHVTKGGLHKIECQEVLKDYVYYFGRLRGLGIRFELSMPAVADIDDSLDFDYVVDSGTLTNSKEGGSSNEY